MATITPVPLYMKDALVKVGADNFEAGVSGVTLTPTTPTATWTGLTPTSGFSASGTPTWVATIDYVQDWETTGSLSNYLLANSGKTVVMEFTPKNKTGKKFTVNAQIVPGPVGGPGGAYAVATVSLGIDTPVPSAAATA